MAKRILIVDDEDDVVQLVAYHLRQASYQVITAVSCAAAEAEIRRERPDLVVLDVGLPDEPGTELARRLRRDPVTTALPIIILSARTSEIDRVVAFELGVDDYVTKPFSPRELALRVGAVLRREHQSPLPAGDTLAIGEIVVDIARHRVSVSGAALELTRREFALLLELVAQHGRVQTREALLSRVWSDTGNIDARTVDTHVKRLREKLGPAGDRIETVRGVGYRMSDEDDATAGRSAVAED